MRPACWLCLFAIAAVSLSGCGKSQDSTGASPPPPADAPASAPANAVVPAPPAAATNATSNAVSVD